MCVPSEVKTLQEFWGKPKDCQYRSQRFSGEITVLAKKITRMSPGGRGGGISPYHLDIPCQINRLSEKMNHLLSELSNTCQDLTQEKWNKESWAQSLSIDLSITLAIIGLDILPLQVYRAGVRGRKCMPVCCRLWLKEGGWESTWERVRWRGRERGERRGWAGKGE